jgi:cyanophycinase
VNGTLALVGAGEFLDKMDAVDRILLDRADGTRVVVLPTASAPDGPGVPERWARTGVEHFNRLGAQTAAVMALTHADCMNATFADSVRASNLVYFSGGKPDYLADTLAGTAVWEAVVQVFHRGGVLAGCSAGAMIMGGYVPEFSRRLGIPRIGRWKTGFGLVARAVIAPHYNEFPAAMVDLMFGRRPADSFLIGIDAHTALVGSIGHWQVMGAGRVTLRRGRETRRFTHGQTVSLEL